MFRQFKPLETTVNFLFKDPDTGMIHRGNTLQQLYTNIILYREQNRLERIENLREVVENYLCSLSENCNKCQPKELQRSFWVTVKGGVALLKNLAFKKFATQAVAEERASQCVQCRYNVFPDKGPFISFADNLAEQQVGERRTSKHELLGNCEVCTCSLRSKVFVDAKLPKFKSEEVVKLKAVNCWQLKLSNQ